MSAASGRRWTGAEDGVLVTADRRATLGDADVASLADALARSVEAVRIRQGKLGLLLPRSEQLVPRWRRRQFATAEERRRHRSELLRRRLAVRGHPRGFAGRRHSTATRARLAAGARRGSPVEVPTPRSEWVYFIRASDGRGPIKVGRSVSPRSRLAELQLSSPVRLTILATVPGGREREAELHRRFATCRLHGEWFEPVGALLELVSRARRESEGSCLSKDASADRVAPGSGDGAGAPLKQASRKTGSPGAMPIPGDGAEPGATRSADAAPEPAAPTRSPR